MQIWLWNTTLVSVEVTADIVIGNPWKECFFLMYPNQKHNQKNGQMGTSI